MGDTFRSLGAVTSVFGSGDSPGLAGTGQQRFEQKPLGQPKKNPDGSIMYAPPSGDSKRMEAYFNGTDPGDPVYEQDPYKAWQDPQAEARRAQLSSQEAAVQQRNAPTSKAAQIDLNAIERTQGTQANLAQGKAATLGQAERVGPINIGQATTYGGASIDPAERIRAAQLSNEQNQFRQAQGGLASQLQDQAAGKGPSLATGQLKEATDRTLAQQAGLAASQGGDSALAKRQLGMQAAQANQQTARDAAQMRIQEQQGARQQLAGLSGQAREQDIGYANAQAQLAQQANLANAQAFNQRAMQQAGLTQQAGLFSAGALNERQMQQAAMNAQLAQANQAAGNQFQLQQAGFGQQMNLANMDAANRAYLQNAQLSQQANLANQQYYNQGLFGNTGYQQQTNLANQQAALQQQQLNDAMARYYSEAGLGLDARQQQAMMEYQMAQLKQSLGTQQLEQQAYEGTREGIGGLFSGLGSAVGGLAMLSDKRSKKAISNKSADDKIGEFLSSYSATSVSDEKAKKLETENEKLKAMQVGQFMQANSGKGFMAGLGKGLNVGAQISMAQDDRKSKSNSHAAKPAIAAPTPAAHAPAPPTPMMDRTIPNPLGGSIDRTNPYSGEYHAPIQTWSTPTNSREIIRENPFEISSMDAKTGIRGAGSPIASFLNSFDKGPMSLSVSDEKVKSFLDKTHAYSYEYKPEYKDKPGAGEGRYVSPMAQDLEKSELGKSMVKQAPDGTKMVDYGKGLGTMVASLAYLNDRLNEIEGKKSGKKGKR
jgi:hypothetical protein